MPEDLAGEHVDVVVKPDEFGCGSIEEGVGQAGVEGIENGVDGDEHHQDDAGQCQEHRVPAPAFASLRYSCSLSIVRAMCQRRWPRLGDPAP